MELQSEQGAVARVRGCRVQEAGCRMQDAGCRVTLQRQHLFCSGRV